MNAQDERDYAEEQYNDWLLHLLGVLGLHRNNHADEGDHVNRDIINARFKRVVTPGSFTKSWWYGGSRPIRVFVEIEYRFDRNQKWELSLTGVAGPKTNGDAVGSCGQIDHALDKITAFEPGWDLRTVMRLHDIWARWHLNGMQAGSPRQMAWLRDHPVTSVYPESHYEKAKEALRLAGREPDHTFFHNDKPYSYGSAWLYEPVPNDVLVWLYNLPKAAWRHPWGDRDRLIEGR